MEVQDPVLGGASSCDMGVQDPVDKVWGSCDLVWGALGSIGWAISLQWLRWGDVMIRVRDLRWVRLGVPHLDVTPRACFMFS